MERLSKYNTNTYPNSSYAEIIDNILIEIISLAKRFIKQDERLNTEMIEKLTKYNLIDQLIFLLHKDNTIILKLLHMLLIPMLEE